VFCWEFRHGQEITKYKAEFGTLVGSWKSVVIPCFALPLSNTSNKIGATCMVKLLTCQISIGASQQAYYLSRVWKGSENEQWSAFRKGGASFQSGILRELYAVSSKSRRGARSFGWLKTSEQSLGKIVLRNGPVCSCDIDQTLLYVR
jgi:hypothetical protein